MTESLKTKLRTRSFLVAKQSHQQTKPTLLGKGNGGSGNYANCGGRGRGNNQQSHEGTRGKMPIKTRVRFGVTIANNLDTILQM